MAKIIAIAGGSGSGKTTLTWELQRKYPEQIEVIHFDDYQRAKKEVPLTALGVRNWDHPDVINFQNFVADLKELKEGKSVSLLTKSRKINPQYEKIGRVPHTYNPRPIIIIDGYLSLYDKSARDLYDLSIFLDAHEHIRLKRRDKPQSEQYKQEILVPAHNEFLEPTKEFADIIIDVNNLTAKQVLERVEKEIFTINH